MEKRELPDYEAPRVVTYTEEELLETLGPAHTGTICGDNLM